MNTYLDPYDYSRAATGHNTTTLLANLARLSTGGVAVSATSLPLTVATTAQLNQYDEVYIFDGASSEIVTVSTATAPGASSIPCSATEYAHAAGIAVCSDGASGSVGALIISASRELENYCRQPLLQATYSNEQLSLRTMRASVDRDGRLVLRPRQFPVTTLTSAALQFDASSSLTLDVTQAFIDNSSGAQSIAFARILQSGGSGNSMASAYYSPVLLPATPGWVSLSYTAGFVYAALPWEVKQGAIRITSALLSDRFNPTGASEIAVGKRHIVSRQRGDNTGLSLLQREAYLMLQPYRQLPM